MKTAIEKRLQEAGQEHALAFWKELDDSARRRFLHQLESLDLDLINKLWTTRHASADWRSLAARAEPPPAIRLDRAQQAATSLAAQKKGEAALRAGEIGMLLVAGGQGTRLGFAHPKGMFRLGPVSNRSLFQILLEQLLAARRRFDAPIPLYVMTSPATHEETAAYLAEHDYFGLPAADVQLFCQGVMPAVAIATGKLLLAGKDALFLSPDGHGGMLSAFESRGCLNDLQQRGIKQLYYCQIDNPLVCCCEPELLGHHLLAHSEMTTQAVARTNATDRVGNIVSVDGRLHVIEYSDLPQDAAQARDETGLRLWAGNIAVHVFSTDFLVRAAGDSESLPFHLAHKATPHLDANGVLQTPEAPNAIKFERFIFDLLPQAANGLVVEVDKAERFAPVKNAPGSPADTAAHSQAAICAQHRYWLRAAGAKVDDQTAVEINPLFAIDAAELAEKIAPGTVISQPTYFQ